MTKHITLLFILVLVLGSASFGQGTATLQQVYATPGDSVEVDLNVTNFIGIGSFQFFIQVNPAVLQFGRVTNFPDVGGILPNVLSGGSVVSMTWTSFTAPITVTSGRWMSLKFHYSGGTSPVAFNGGIQEVTPLATLIPIDVAYTDGWVSHIVGHNARIGFVTMKAPGAVGVPVTFDAMPTDSIMSLQLKIYFDNSRLTYTGFTDDKNTTPQVILDNDFVTVVWVGENPININGTFITLNFTYNNGGSGCPSAPVTFDRSYCELAKFPGIVVPTNYFDGGVNMKFKVSGTLRYNSEPNASAPLNGFKVYLETNPGLVKLDSVTTNATGKFEFMRGNGNYKVIVSAPDTAQWYADFDDFDAIFNYLLGYDIPYTNALRIKAGDLNQNGDIDFDDFDDLFNRLLGFQLPDYTAPDWVFEDPDVTVSCDDVLYPSLMGLTSGNVLGTNPNP